MGYRPLGDRLLVKPKPSEEKTKSGIVLPDSAKEKPQEGKVIAAGEGARNEKGDKIPMEVKAGDVVLYSKYSGTEVKIDGEEHLIIKESDVLAIVK
ncbi:MAG: co-chaperone GroES [Actinobacteria bacterium]|nr:co-chaperone GroES [Actinomycetota bacterium]MBU4483582.1 co-chaperone GroES [Actinomycetota bacterium]MCG2791089.1 co-chaperone GroES [Actinomycetes bacterium]